MKLKNTHAFGLLLALSLIAITVQAQNTADPNRKLTLGDLIKKVKEDSRQSQLNKLQKSSIVVPDTKVLFEEKKAVNLAAVKPPKLSEIYEYDNRDKAEYEKTLNLQINELYKLTQKFKNSTSRGELWLRLAELYVEKANIVDARKQTEYDQKLADFQSGKTKVKPVLELAEARDYNKKAIQLYDWFLRDFPDDQKVPQALFFLGYNYFELNDIPKGTSYYEQLTTRYPNSNFSGEAHFAMGENLFDNENWVNAYKEYAFLLKDKKNSLHIIAMYKAAWCLYRLGKTEEAIKYMDYIVKSGQISRQQAASGKKVNGARLENEALKDLVVFYADIDDTQRTINYFSSLKIKNWKDYVERYGYYISDKGNREASREVFKYLIAQDPNAKKAFEYQYQIVQNYFFSKNSPEFKSELYRWVTAYNTKSSWYKTNASDTAFVTKSNQLREQTLRNYVLQQHQTAQNSRAEFSQQAAEQGYKLYFQEFSQSPQAGDMHFYYGELLYDLKKYGEASNEYAIIGDQNLKSQFGEKASQNLLLALEKSLPTDEELQKKVGNSTQPVALDQYSERFIKAANQSLEKYPKSANAGEIRFRVGRLYYLTNNFDPAEKYFRDVVKLHPRTKISEYSANLLLDIYNLRNDYNGLDQIGAELLANPDLANTKTGADIRSVLEKSSFKRAQNLEIEKKYLESAQQFQQFYAQNPKAELAGVASFNAAVNFERAGRDKEAIQNYNHVLASNDKLAEKFKAKSKRLVAKLYQDTGQFDQAARVYADLVKTEPKDPLVANYQFNLALMHELSGQTEAAVKEYKRYTEINSNKEENAAIAFKIAQIHREAKKLTEASREYKAYIELPYAKADKKVEAMYHAYDLDRQLKRRIDVGGTEVKMVSLMAKIPNDKRGAANSFLAKVKLDDAKKVYEKLKAIRIPNNPAKQKAAVDSKLEMVNALNDRLAQIIKLDSPEEIVSAITLLGDANNHMAEAFQGVPVPANLSEENKKMYLQEVQKIIAPFISKSEESYKLAVTRAGELQVYNQDYAHAFAQLNKKFPDQYYGHGEFTTDSKKIDWMER